MVDTARRPDEDEEEGQPDRFVVLLRHGEAEEKKEGKTDEERSLTGDGHAWMKQIALGLESAFPKAQVIYSSPLLRATQSALWVSKAYRSRIKVHSSDALRPQAPYARFEELLDSIKERRIIMVGHEPHLTTTLMKLVGLSGSSAIDLQKGGCYGVRVRSDGNHSFEWLLPPKILLKMTEED